MLKTVLIIILSVSIIGIIFFIIVRNLLKRKLDELVEIEKRKNQIILSNFLNSIKSKFKTLLDKSKLKPPCKYAHIFFVE